MTTALDRGWGNPGAPGSREGADYRRRHIVAIDAGGARLYVRREVAHLFRGFIDEITSKGYRIDGRADDWGYAHRAIRGYEDRYAKTKDPRWLSNHSWGLAVDLNAQDHPLGRRGSGVPTYVVEAGRRWGLSWGGDYVNRPDEMHWEWLRTPAEVDDFPTGQELTMDADAEREFEAIKGRFDVLAQAVAHLAEQVEIIRHSVAGYGTKNDGAKIVRDPEKRSTVGRIEDLVTPKKGQ